MKKTLLLLSCLAAITSAEAQTFAPPVAYKYNAQAIKALAVDLNRDQYPDVVITGGAANTLVVLLNNQTGGFLPAQAYPTGAYCSGVAVSALNCDAFPDLLVTTTNDNQVQAFYGSAAGTFTPGTTYPAPVEPSDVTAADYDGDGKPDFAVASLRTGQVSVYLNTSSGATCPSTFAAGVSYATESGPFSASMLKSVDLNQDSKQDVVVVNSANAARKGLSALFSTATGTLSAPSQYNTGTSFVFDATFARLNADNALDAVYSDPDNKAISVLLGSTSAPFLGAPVGFALSDAPLGVGSGDFNQDGKRDVATVLRNGKVELLLGSGTGTLALPATVATIPDAVWLLAADFNRDGSQDITTVGGGNVTVLLNQPTIVLSNRPALSPRALGVYPNPNNGSFQLATGGSLQIVDLAGRPIPFTRTGTSVVLTNATPGLYLVELSTATERRRQTVLIH